MASGFALLTCLTVLYSFKPNPLAFSVGEVSRDRQTVRSCVRMGRKAAFAEKV